MHMSLNRGVLVATDGSTSAARAEGIAAAIAAGCMCRLVIVTISGSLPVADLRQLAHAEGDLGAAEHKLTAQVLEGAAERASSAGVKDVSLVCEDGDPAITIIEIANREQVDLIVVGSRGEGLLSQLLIGSVSRSVLNAARCAVMVVP